MRDNLQVGDEIITIGGIYGRVISRQAYPPLRRMRKSRLRSKTPFNRSSLSKKKRKKQRSKRPPPQRKKRRKPSLSRKRPLNSPPSRKQPLTSSPKRLR